MKSNFQNIVVFIPLLLRSVFSAEDYDHAKAVWKRFDIKNMGEYHDFYLKTDVLLLADVFENFRSFCLTYYKLDPIHYSTLPGFAWDACLLLTKVQLELIQDENMYQFFEQGIRGGISSINHRYAKANNPYLEGYKQEDPLSYILLIDCNNLYGAAMIEKLPFKGFIWENEAKLRDIDWLHIDTFGDEGYILEVSQPPTYKA